MTPPLLERSPEPQLLLQRVCAPLDVRLHCVSCNTHPLPTVLVSASVKSPHYPDTPVGFCRCFSAILENLFEYLLFP